MFDINDPFYQDICTPYKSSVNTDMLLSDRIYYIYNNGNAQCQQNCYFTGYFSGSQYINCTCSIGEENNVIEEKFKPEKLYESFFEILKYSNYKILKCYKLISSNKIIKENIGSIILIIFFVVYIISLIFYIIKGVNPLKNKIKELKAKEEENKVYSEEIRINPNIFDNKNKEENNKIVKIIKYPPKKKKSLSFKKSSIEVDKKKNIDLSKTQNINSQLRKNSHLENLVSKNENNKESKEEKFDDFELSELEYKEAVKYDKRPFIKIYFALLKREHKILFTFFIHNDYNLFYIKIWRFIFLIASDMAMNALFFTDETMHKLYLSYGKYDFIQQIPQIVYSTVVSQLIDVFLCFLSLTDRAFYQIRKIELNEKNEENINKIYKCINIKLISFFIFTFIFFAIFWYIIVIFCIVYENTQIAFIKDTMFSFLSSIIFPFVIYLIPSSLRVWAIRDEKIRLNCIYKLSDVIPFF